MITYTVRIDREVESGEYFASAVIYFSPHSQIVVAKGRSEGHATELAAANQAMIRCMADHRHHLLTSTP